MLVLMLALMHGEVGTAWHLDAVAPSLMTLMLMAVREEEVQVTVQDHWRHLCCLFQQHYHHHQQQYLHRQQQR